MRKTEFASACFGPAVNSFRPDQKDPKKIDQVAMTAGLRSLAMGLDSLAEAIRDIYDKLEKLEKLQTAKGRPVIEGELEIVRRARK